MQPHEHYAQLCAARALPLDAALHGELRSCSPALHVAAPHLPVLGALFARRDAPLAHVTHVVVRARAFAAPALDAPALAALTALIGCHAPLADLSLAGVPLDRPAYVALLAALARAPASRLRRLDLSRTGLDCRAAFAVAPFLAADLARLEHLDLSNNRANQRGVHVLHKYLALRDGALPPLCVHLDGNLVLVEALNACSHGLGAGAALFGAYFMLRRALAQHASLPIVAAVAVFLLSLFTLLTSSCVYHSCFRHPATSRRMRRADHCSIFLLIAGSYTPFIMRYSIDPLLLRGPLTLTAVWICALVGIYRSVLGADTSRNRALFALLTGWLGSFSAKTLIHRMHSGALLLVVLGGVVYSVGIVFYLLGNKRPMMHVIWHLFVLLAGGLHYAAVWHYVLDSV